MTQEELRELFSRMGFFEVEEGDGVVVFCYEPDENGPYLIASDALGETPKADARMTIACYSPKDAFLWGREVKNINILAKLYEKSGGGQKFFEALQPQS